MFPHGRHDYPRAIHLVSVQGRPGGAIFFSADIFRERLSPWKVPPELQFWESLVARACDRYAARVHAYAWLPNEALLILQRFAVPLDTVVASVLGQYSRHLHQKGRMPKGVSPYRSRYESVEVTPGALPYGVRHIYWHAAEFSASPIEYPFCSYGLHYEEAPPRWFERRDFIDGLEQRGYFGRIGGDRFLLRPETNRHKTFFGSRGARRADIHSTNCGSIKDLESMSRVQKGRCTECGDPLWGEIVHLKLDGRTHTYTDQFIPQEYFKGIFPFGRICAISARGRHRERGGK